MTTKENLISRVRRQCVRKWSFDFGKNFHQWVKLVLDFQDTNNEKNERF